MASVNINVQTLLQKETLEGAENKLGKYALRFVLSHSASPEDTKILLLSETSRSRGGSSRIHRHCSREVISLTNRSLFLKRRKHYSSNS